MKHNKYLLASQQRSLRVVRFLWTQLRVFPCCCWLGEHVQMLEQEKGERSSRTKKKLDTNSFLKMGEILLDLLVATFEFVRCSLSLLSANFTYLSSSKPQNGNVQSNSSKTTPWHILSFVQHTSQSGPFRVSIFLLLQLLYCPSCFPP